MADGGEADGGADAGEPADAGPGGPEVIPILAAWALAGDGGIPLRQGAENVVDPESRFEVELAARAEDARLSLLDELEAVVPSTGTTVHEARSRFTVAPKEPLRAGSSYQLRVDGTLTREAHDASGRSLAPASLKLKTSGERPPPPPPDKKHRGKKRRR